MARRESEVETFIDTLSSGDSNNMKSKQNIKEVNNNEVDELSKDFSEMGCIVDAVKRPPNICVETCIYESDGEDSVKSQHEVDEDAYSDEFEEDKSEDEESVKIVSKAKSDETNLSSVKLAQSQSSVCSNKAPASVSGRSGRSDFGSVSVPQTRRINMSFTNARLREIERHNHILLTKILSARNAKKSSIPPPREQPVKKPVPSAAVTRKHQQRKIDHDNMTRRTDWLKTEADRGIFPAVGKGWAWIMLLICLMVNMFVYPQILLKKIQRAKSSALSIRR